MFELHNLGALCAGVVLIGAFQLSGDGSSTEVVRTGLAPSDARMVTDVLMRADSGLGAFAQPDEPITVVETALLSLGDMFGHVRDTGRTVIAALTD